jgi:WS/DGAT/MGAT family acyltransferase
VDARQLPRRLGSLDAAFLHLETDEAPLHVGGVSLVDGDVTAADLAARLGPRLLDTPRYRQRVVAPPLGVGHPVWERDPAFDVRGHVLESHLGGAAGDAALRTEAARLLAARLPRDRPLWDLHVLRGVDGHRSAIVSRVHHCMVDGVSGVELMHQVFDLTPDGRTRASVPPPSLPRPAGDVALVVEAVREAAATGLAAGGALLRSVGALRTSWRDIVARAVDTTTTLAGAASQPVRRLPFNRTLTGERRLGFLRWPVADLRALGQPLGGTLNDVVLSVLAGGIGRWLAATGVNMSGHALRVLVPVNVRRDDEQQMLGNRVSMIPVEVPFDGPPADRLAQTIARTAAMKRVGLAELVDRAADLVDVVPATVYGAVLSLAASPGVISWSAPLRSARFLTANLVCTNVPGPPVPLYCLGHPLLAHQPFVPLAFETGLNCAMLTYNRTLHLTLVADAGAIADLTDLSAAIEASLQDLRAEVAGTTASRRRPARPR